MTKGNLGRRIGIKDVRGLKPGESVWDGGAEGVGGFHARRQKSKTVSYVIAYRTAEGRQRWHTIGRHGAPWTPEAARDAAKRILGHVVEGADPAAEKRAKRDAAHVSELCDMYLEDAQAGRLLTKRSKAKKSSTIATDKGRIERHIKPLLGALKVSSVTQDDVNSFLHAVAEGKTAARVRTKNRGIARVRGGKGTASRTLGLLGGIFTYAVQRRMRPDNPARGVARFADGKRDRRLKDEEYEALGLALRKAEAEDMWPPAIHAVSFLALTGWRSGEALNLKWSEIDLTRRTAKLGDTKTGESVRPLSNAACDLLRGITIKSGQLVFPATRGDCPMKGFFQYWNRIAKLEGLPSDVTPHVLRHSFASLAADLGYSEPTIAALIGHKGQSMTSRYIHTADALLLAAADGVASRTAELMGEHPKPAKVIPIRGNATA